MKNGCNCGKVYESCEEILEQISAHIETIKDSDFNEEEKKLAIESIDAWGCSRISESFMFITRCEMSQKAYEDNLTNYQRKRTFSKIK